MQKLKIIAGIKVWREEDFILPCLGSIYNIVDVDSILTNLKIDKEVISCK